MKYFAIILCIFSFSSLLSQNKLFYAGNEDQEAFYDIVQLSDGSILVAGAADNLNWIPNNITPIELQSHNIANNQGTNKVAFLLLLDSTLNQILEVVHLTKGAAENFKFIKSTNAPRTATADIYISGNTEDSDEGGYFIGKLNGNFVDALPTAFEWTKNIKCTSGSYPKTNQPWDVDSKGRVYYVRGDSHAWNWSAMYRLDANGEQGVVENWRTHWKVGGGEYRNTPASSYSGGIDSIDFSGIVFKRDGRCNMRSWNTEDYELWQSDGNGGTKKGKWPLDVLFDSPCDPQDSDNQSSNGPGYTDYSPGSTFTYGPASVTVDRRNDDLYLGLNAKSVLPQGQPDFEPAILKMDSTGLLEWWSRLYHEVRPDGSAHNSSPDQYIDGIAIDYSQALPFSQIVVNARCHGNNVENFWEGDEILNNPNANGYQNRFTGSTGNIHISWLGKLSSFNGNLIHSTYVAELGNSATGLGSAHPDPLMDNWPNPNAGWPELNTTRLIRNAIKTTSDGSILILGTGRRTMTTKNAYQKMPRPNEGGQSRWNDFVRLYSPTLENPLYSSIVVGSWDTLDANYPKNVSLHNSFKTAKGILVVGQHTGEDGELVSSEVPDWASNQSNGQSAIIGYFEAAEIENANDSPVVENPVTSIDNISKESFRFDIIPNPNDGYFELISNIPIQGLSVFNVYGQNVWSGNMEEIELQHLQGGVYFLLAESLNGEKYIQKMIIK